MRPIGATSGLLGITLLLAGCSGDERAVALPSPTTAAPLPTPSASSEVDEIKGVYTELIEVLYRADSIPPPLQRKRLSAYMANPQLSRVLRRLKEKREQRIVSYGRHVVHIKSVTLDGQDAVLRDCQDSSDAGIMKVDTKKKIKRGSKEEDIKVYMSKLGDGHWRVLKMVLMGQGC